MAKVKVGSVIPSGKAAMSKPAQHAPVVGTPVSDAADTFGHFVNEVNINVRNPIPMELENTFGYSVGGNRYIPFLTERDDDYYGFDTFFNVLLNTRKESPTLGAVLNSKVKFAMGDGIYVRGVDATKVVDPKWQSFVNTCNSEPEGLNSVLHSIITNMLNFGNAPIEIVKGETAGKRWLHVYSKNQLDCRKGWPDGNNESTALIISRFFRKRGIMNLTQKFNIRIPFYKMGAGNKDRFWVEDTVNNQGVPTGKTVYRTALWLKNKYSGYDHYGLPEWIEAIMHCNLEYRGAAYNHDNLKNGMNVGGPLTLEGDVAPGEVREIARDLRKTYEGVGKGGRAMVVASKDTIKTDWKPFDVHKDGSFISLAELSKDAIIMANSWDGAFLGNKDGMTKAKSGAYLNELYQQKIKTVIKPLHRIIKDGFLTPLCEIADEWLGTNWSALDLDIQVSSLFNDTTEASTTVNGINALLTTIKLVGTGVLPHENAVNLLIMKWGMSRHDAEGVVNGINVTPDIKPNIVENT